MLMKDTLLTMTTVPNKWFAIGPASCRAADGDSMERMQKHSLDALAREQLDAAGRSSAGRAAATVVGGHEHVLRQTLVALTAGSTLADHENPGEATVYVLTGRVELTVGEDSWEARSGDLVEIPPARHGLKAVEDSAVLLTAVPRAHTA